MAKKGVSKAGGEHHFSQRANERFGVWRRGEKEGTNL